MRDAIRVRHSSIRTEDAYVNWVRPFIRLRGTRHPIELGESEVNAFLTHLAVERQVAASPGPDALSGDRLGTIRRPRPGNCA